MIDYSNYKSKAEWLYYLVGENILLRRFHVNLK